MSEIKLHYPARKLSGTIKLSGSKSISNRLLIIQALSKVGFEIVGLAEAEDSQLLQKALETDQDLIDVHHAGTSFRFLCSYLCLKPGEQILTGSERMKQRPIAPLVDALRSMGAHIEYLENEGFPPLKIGVAKWNNKAMKVKIDASISSQYISSLLLIAPVLPGGLTIELDGTLVSKPYIDMTLALMGEYGIKHQWIDNSLKIKEQEYVGQDRKVEADWSAASYYFSWVALNPGSSIFLEGLRQKSIQGDAKIIEMMTELGVESTFVDDRLHLQHVGAQTEVFEWNFIKEPDLAQTISVTCAALGITGLFSGLKTLRIKETDRIAALQTELEKVGVFLNLLPSKFSKDQSQQNFLQEGKASWETTPVFETYNDHRMAMAFSVLSSKGEIVIKNPDVVMKSYPNYWDDMAKLMA